MRPQSLTTCSFTIFQRQLLSDPRTAHKCSLTTAATPIVHLERALAVASSVGPESIRVKSSLGLFLHDLPKAKKGRA